MRIFIFEFTTGGGLLAADSAAPRPATIVDDAAHTDLSSLAAEGGAMVAAVAADFAALADTQVRILHDGRSALCPPPGVEVRKIYDHEKYRAAFDEEAARADQTIVIAPECDGILLALVERVLAVGGRLLGPSPDIVRLASDKHETAEHLLIAGVPAPLGALLQETELLTDGTRMPPEVAFPLVLKPCDGAGSSGVRRLDQPAAIDISTLAGRWRLERFCPGLAASVALLCGPAGYVALPPCAQSLSDDGRFRYRGGRLPLDPAFAERAVNLAHLAAATLDSPLGYLGIDIVLGADAAGRDDVVIEINPRLTTSYVGLRAATPDILAAAMLDVAAGRAPALSFTERRIEFACDGSVKIC